MSENLHCSVTENDLKAVSSYISANWKNTVRPRDYDKNFPLPYDFVPPCMPAPNAFVSLYYWDTYFTNVGLYLDGMGEYCFNNIECLKFALNKFGCVPNFCRKGGADYASQPPLLFLMVCDYYEFSKDKKWLKETIPYLEKEYAFWMSKRIAENGLNRYGTNYDYAANKNVFCLEYAERTGKDVSACSDEEIVNIAINANAEGESGEDHTPRFLSEAASVNPIDLNCYLYAFERQLSEFCKITETAGSEEWDSRAEKRLALMQKYLFDERTGVYFDYNFKRDKRSEIYCAACWLPFVFGITKDKAALEKINEKLIFGYGVASCQKMPDDGQTYQWGYPNSWAPHNYWGFMANDVAGDAVSREKIRNGWLKSVALEFKTSGKLFEKYDALNGGKAVFNEYGLPEMMGWTAGVYQKFYKTAKF